MKSLIVFIILIMSAQVVEANAIKTSNMKKVPVKPLIKVIPPSEPRKGNPKPMPPVVKPKPVGPERHPVGA